MIDQEKVDETISTEKDGTQSLTTKIASLKGIPLEEDLIKILKTGIASVTFTKLNGDERVMTCTKSYDVIPEQYHPKSDKKTNGTINVWDVNAQGWRSFKYDRVSKVEKYEV